MCQYYFFYIFYNDNPLILYSDFYNFNNYYRLNLLLQNIFYGLYCIFSLKTTEELGYGVVKSYERLILSVTIFRSEQFGIDEVVFKKSTELVVSLCGLNSAFLPAGVKGLRP